MNLQAKILNERKAALTGNICVTPQVLKQDVPINRSYVDTFHTIAMIWHPFEYEPFTDNPYFEIPFNLIEDFAAEYNDDGLKVFDFLAECQTRIWLEPGCDKLHYAKYEYPKKIGGGSFSIDKSKLGSYLQSRLLRYKVVEYQEMIDIAVIERKLAYFFIYTAQGGESVISALLNGEIVIAIGNRQSNIGIIDILTRTPKIVCCDPEIAGEIQQDAMTSVLHTLSKHFKWRNYMEYAGLRKEELCNIASIQVHAVVEAWGEVTATL